jgi:hypothetical protein
VRRAVAVVVIMAVGLLAGCSSSSKTATVHGLLGGYLVGGPQAAHPRWVPRAGTVQAFQGSTVVAAENVANDGDFSLRLSPGSYLLEGTSSPPSQLGQPCGPTVIQVKANVTISARVRCVMPSIN